MIWNFVNFSSNIMSPFTLYAGEFFFFQRHLLVSLLFQLLNTYNLKSFSLLHVLYKQSFSQYLTLFDFKVIPIPMIDFVSTFCFFQYWF